MTKVTKTETISILGGGNFGTALAITLARNHYKIKIWLRDYSLVKEINTTRFNPRYLTNFKFPSSIEATDNIKKAIKSTDLIIFCVPSLVCEQTLDLIINDIKPNQKILLTMKGLISKEYITPSRLIENKLIKKGLANSIGVIGGPNLAKEIAECNHSGMDIASKDHDLVKFSKKVFENRWLKVKPSDDVMGVELLGALKNIYAIAAGCLDQFDDSHNTKSLFIVECLKEIQIIAKNFGVKAETVTGLSGLGDLITTSFSNLSRNYRFGKILASDIGANEANALIGSTTEGLYNLQMIKKIIGDGKIKIKIINRILKIINKYEPASSIVKIFD